MSDEWAAELGRLHQALRKTGLIALLLLYFALSGVSTAMERVNGPEAAVHFARVTSADKDTLERSVSYVFGAQLDDLAEGSERASSEVTDEVARAVELLAREWFQARFSLLGATITVDLRVVAPVLPFAVVLTAAYCWLLSRKIAFLHSWPRAAGAADADALDVMLRSRQYRSHPNLLATIASLLIALALVVYLIAQMEVFLELVSERDRVTYLCAVATAIVWAILYCAHVTTALRGRRVPERGWLFQLHRGVRAMWRVAMLRARRRVPHLQVGSGALLVLATLWMLTADSCGSARAGYRYFKLDDASWFNGGPFGAISDVVMWPSYAGLVIVSVIALLFMMAGASKRARSWIGLARQGAWLASALSRAALLMVACTVCFFTGRDNLGDFVALVAWVWAAGWLWKARARPIVRARRELALLLILIPPALSFGVFASRQLWDERLLGVPCFSAGVLLQARVYQWFGARATAPAVRVHLSRVVAGIRRGFRRTAPSPP